MVLHFLFCLQRRCSEGSYYGLFLSFLIWFGMQYPSSLTRNLDMDI